MKTLKNNTFANSPKSVDGYPANVATRHSFSPGAGSNVYVDMPELKRQMEEALHSRKKTSKSKRGQYQKYSSQVSLMKSNISLLSIDEEPADLPLRMLQLEIGFTEEILGLRQDKITIMQESNKTVDKRFGVQRQLNVMKKNISKQKAEQEENCSQRRTVNEKEEEMLNEIQSLIQNCHVLNEKISKIDSSQGLPEGTHRFQTFYPQPKGRSQLINNYPAESLDKLRSYRSSLFQKLANRVTDYQPQTMLYDLIEENTEILQRLHSQLISANDQNNIIQLSRLRSKVELQNRDKQKFLESLKVFKEKANLLRIENTAIRRQLQI